MDPAHDAPPVPEPDPFEVRLRELIAQGDGDGIAQAVLTDRAAKLQEIMNYANLLEQASSSIRLDDKSKAHLLPKPEFFYGMDSKLPSVHQWLCCATFGTTLYLVTSPTTNQLPLFFRLPALSTGRLLTHTGLLLTGWGLAG
jgi:hypothetical protein